jgi:mannose-6-phosphate isomerase-like protein (cupin superfamily)
VKAYQGAPPLGCLFCIAGSSGTYTSPVAGYTIRNLKEIEDSATSFGLSPNLEARFASVPLECEQVGLSYQRIAPNFRVPFGHRHREQEEVYVVVSGSGRVKLDDDVVELRQWDAVRVSSGTMRNFEAGPEGAEIIAFGAPSTGASPASDVELTPEWWSDSD